MEILLALSSAIAYGASDFTGGILTRRAHVFTVILLSQTVAFALLLLALPLWSGAFSWPAFGWGAAAGVGAFGGASLLYRGLAIGRMNVVAPITGVLSAAIPVLFGLAIGERPGVVALTGVVLGLVAVALVSRAPEGAPSVEGSNPELDVHARVSPRRGTTEAFGAGVGFALFFILLERAPAGSGLWPLAGTRASLIAAVLSAAATVGAPMRVARAAGLTLVGLGFINVLADLLYLLATRAGLLSLVVVITSLYPAFTILLARLVLKERMIGQQMLGLALAAVGVALIAAG